LILYVTTGVQALSKDIHMAIAFSDSTPAAPAGSTNVIWAQDTGGNVSASTLTAPVLSPELALTGQGADVPTTVLVASIPTTARYRVTAYVVVTTVDAVSSTLPAVIISWTDGDNVQAETDFLIASNTGNTLTTSGSGTLLINADALNSIAVSTLGYASNTPSEMKFSLYCDIELLS